MSLPILRETADTVRIFAPGTGEEIDPATAPLGRLAEWRHAMRSYEEDARIAKQTVDAAILARMDEDVEWTKHEDGYIVTAPSPAPAFEYDPTELREALLAAGINAAAVAKAVVETIDYKVSKRGLDALRKLGPHVAAIIDEHSREIPKARRVTVKSA